MSDFSVAWQLLAVTLVLIGLAGAVLPALPGLPLVWAGLWLAAWAEDYARIGASTLWLLAGLALLGMALDAVAGWLGARAYGASRQALWGALLGSLVGLLFGLPGLLLGPLVGAVIGEWLARRDAWRAGQVGVATLFGLVLGMLAKIGCALAMLLVFAWAWWA
ncbi:MAG: hypothetical protein RI925_1571 [Pseudomonadota bacterium]